MNCVELFFRHAKETPKKVALRLPDGSEFTFEEIALRARKTQSWAYANHVQAGDGILMLAALDATLYGAIIGLLGLGAHVIFVEPWMSISRVNTVIEKMKPRAFFTNALGRCWGLRLSSVRAINQWVSVSQLATVSALQDAVAESVPKDTLGIVTFTSGTTGIPKGVSRTQGYLVDAHRVFSHSLHLDEVTGPDLCVFANFALLNLASGRTSIMVSKDWSKKSLAQLDTLRPELRPVTLSCGPAFLATLMLHAKCESLVDIHCGGALIDCELYLMAFKHWSHANFSHLYGSSEVEPVAVWNAREAVEHSQSHGFHQVLCLGHPIADIKAQHEEDGLWVAGPHVCPKYVGGGPENTSLKRTDSTGQMWHAMGDRVLQNKSDGLWWYAGRAQQPLEDFRLEQRIYSHVKSSEGFIHWNRAGLRYFVTSERGRSKDLVANFPELSGVIPISQIHRDPRHRSRIDRTTTLKKEVPWLVG